MNFKKTIAKSLVVAMAIGTVSVANLQSAKAVVTKVELDNATGMLTATDAKYWSILKEVKSGKGIKIGDKEYTPVSIEEYAGGIDAQTALKGKKGIIGLGEKPALGADWVVKNIGAGDSTFKVYVVATSAAVKGADSKKALGGEYGYLVATIGKSPKAVDLTASKKAIQVKQGESSWSDIETYFGTVDNDKVSAKLKMLSQSGSTLSFRLADSDVFVTKEVKVKVPSAAKAPKVKIDINKDTTSIKNGFEYKIADNVNGLKLTDGKWLSKESKKGLSFADLGITGDKVLAVRTAAKGKKIASKYSLITIKKGVEPPKFVKLEATGASVALGKGKVEVSAKVAYNVEKGAIITNTSTDTDLEFALAPDNTPADKIKWTTLKKAKSESKPTKGNLKFSKEAKVGAYTTDGKTKLYLRVAGVKQTKDNVVTLAGVSHASVVKLANVEQKVKTVDGYTNSEKGASVTQVAIKGVATGKAVTASFDVTLTNIQKTGAKPKVKADKLSGVTVKAGAVGADGKVKFEVNVGPKTFKDDSEITSKKLNVTLSIEGLSETFEISFKK